MVYTPAAVIVASVALHGVSTMAVPVISGDNYLAVREPAGPSRAQEVAAAQVERLANTAREYDDEFDLYAREDEFDQVFARDELEAREEDDFDLFARDNEDLEAREDDDSDLFAREELFDELEAREPEPIFGAIAKIGAKLGSKLGRKKHKKVAKEAASQATDGAANSRRWEDVELEARSGLGGLFSAVTKVAPKIISKVAPKAKEVGKEVLKETAKDKAKETADKTVDKAVDTVHKHKKHKHKRELDAREPEPIFGAIAKVGAKIGAKLGRKKGAKKAAKKVGAEAATEAADSALNNREFEARSVHVMHRRKGDKGDKGGGAPPSGIGKLAAEKASEALQARYELEELD